MKRLIFLSGTVQDPNDNGAFQPITEGVFLEQGDSPGGATKQMLPAEFGSAQNMGSTAVRFLNLGTITSTSPSGTEANCQFVAPIAGTLNDLFVKHVLASIPTDSITYTVRVNGVDTGITCTVAASGQSASDSAHTAAFVGGDLISIKCVQSGAQAAANITVRASLSFTPA